MGTDEWSDLAFDQGRRSGMLCNMLKNPNSLRIGLVEDEILVREVLHKICVQEIDAEVVFETGDCTEAVRKIIATQPDIVILDLALNNGTGFSVAGSTQIAGVGSKFIAISAYCTEYTAAMVNHYDFSGFIDKSTCLINELKEAVSKITQGSYYFCKKYKETRLRTITNHNSFIKILSNSEQSVLSLIGRGMDDSEIAARLSISVRTVQGHRSHAMEKLNIRSVAALVNFAVTEGIARFHTEKRFKTY